MIPEAEEVRKYAKRQVVPELRSNGLVFVKYHDDGTIEIFGNKNGYPRHNGVVPAPDINHASEEERLETFRKATDTITLQGYLITSERRIRNTAFDKRN